MAAFHFDEMSPEAWGARTIRERFEWYYDKTHDLIARGMKNFTATATIATETLGDSETLRAVAHLASVSSPLVAIHLNRHVELDAVGGLEARVWIQRLLGKLDLDRLSVEPAYGIAHFLAEFLLRMRDRVDRGDLCDGGKLAELQESLDSACQALLSGLSAIDELRDRMIVSAARDTVGKATPTRPNPRDADGGSSVLAALKDLRDMVETFRSERDWLQRESTERMRERDAKSAEISAKEAQLQARIQESEERMRERDAKSAEIVVKDAQLQAIYRSTSWRMTRPIRALGSLLGKG